MSNITFPVQTIPQVIQKLNLKVYYPIVTGLPASAQERINRAIHSLAEDLITKQGYYQNPSMQVMGWYELKNNQRGILSLNLGNYAYTPKAAHGLTLIKSLTFDVQTGRSYRLGDLFKPGSNYVEVISEEIRRQIAERDIPVLDDFKGMRPDQDYYIADKALVVYFQQYELAPYYIGHPMFPISVFMLQDIARKDGPIDRMATND